MKRLVLPTVALACLVAAGCGTTARDDFKTLPPLESALPVERAWLRLQLNHFEDRRAGLPLYADERQVIWADSYGAVIGYDINTGKQQWRYETGKPLSSGVGADNERLFIGTIKGEVIVLNRDTGQQLWTARASSELLSPPQIAQDVVVVQSNDGKVFGFDLTGGRELWRYDSKVPALSLRGLATPQVVEDRVILGLADGKLVALNLWDGKERWRVEIATPRGRSELDRMVDVDATPLVVGDVVYAAAFQGRVVAVNIQNGRTLWSREMSSSRGMAARDSMLYVTADDGSIWAIARNNGQVLWRQSELSGRLVTAPAAYGDYIVVGDGAGFIHWIDGKDGHFVHRMRIDYAPLVQPPQAAGGKLLVISGAGVVDALALPE